MHMHEPNGHTQRYCGECAAANDDASWLRVRVRNDLTVLPKGEWLRLTGYVKINVDGTIESTEVCLQRKPDPALR